MLVVLCTVVPAVGLVNMVSNQVGRSSEFTPGVRDWAAFGFLVCVNACGAWFLFTGPSWRSLRRWDERHAATSPG